HPIAMDISTSVIALGDETIIQVILRDIRDRQQVEQSLRESQQFIQTVIDTVPLPVAWKNRDSVFLGCNHQLANLLQLNSVIDIIGKTDFDFSMTEAEAIAYRAGDQEVIASGQPKLNIQETLTLATGEQRWLETHKAPLKNWAGEVIGVVLLMQDITERKRAREQLQRTNAELARATRLKDEFLANMSHELRTPLNAILGMTEGLQEQVFGPITPKQLQALQLIDRSGNHLLDLINDILDIAKIESGHIELDIRSTSLAALCKSCLSFVKQQALKKSIQLDIKAPLTLPELPIDERRIRQVLINLLNNAVKFTADGGSITLEVNYPVCPLHARPHQIASHPVTTYVRIAVTDTGIGLTPDHISKLFQPFIQIDSALNRQYNGTGLGLALVKRITELHQGYVDVTSEFGVGSCFMVFLPYEDAIAGIATPSVHQPVSVDTLTSPSPSAETDIPPLILLAEDNEANISTMSSYLKAKGYRIIVAKNGQEAIDLTESKTPDLILMDVQMPLMDGLEATRHIREVLCSNVPIIALTALAMESDRDRCLATGADEYLSKPVRLKHLTATIQRLLTQP
ncbi:MAG: response regulator, partial [Merismopedia sp. SIO2A8]|nr:response regulator [Merismopedia sp. SIO2A8]